MTLAVVMALAGYFLLTDANWTLRIKEPRTKVFLIGVDAGSWDILKELMAEEKLPHFKKLVQEGAAGYLGSISWKELIRGTKGFFSPIVWASISTGKMPNKHGVEDFTLPLPSDLIASISAQDTSGYAVIRLPDLPPARLQLWLKARATPPAPEKKIGIYANQTLLKEIKLDKDWRIFDIFIPASAWKRENYLNFYYEASEADRGKPVADFNFIRIYNEYDQEVFELHFLREKHLFVGGWQIPDPAKTSIASGYHLRVRTVWDILSEHRKRVGVVGWWETWPAPEVNGYVISSHAGLHGERIKEFGEQWLQRIQKLTYPEDYLKRVQQLAFVPRNMDSEIRKRFYDIGQCSCVGSTQDKIFRNFYWQDRLFETLSLDLLQSKGPFDFFAVYFCGVDAAGHQFLRFKEKQDLLKDCAGCNPLRLPYIVENYYEYMDEVLGKLLPYADRNTVTMIVTDHGQFLGAGTAGLHKNNGFIILHGSPFKTHLLTKAHVLDITPTILYLMGLPVAQDMDGSVLLEAFNPSYLEQHPVAFNRTYETLSTTVKQQKEITDEEAEKEGMEKLKALGYIQE